jgi:hypothetical protein
MWTLKMKVVKAVSLQTLLGEKKKMGQGNFPLAL